MGEPMDGDEAPGGPAAGPEARHSIWPSIHPRLLELIRAHRSTLIFVNSRRLAERLAARLNELADSELVRAHHGSIAREQRLQIEEDLKAGRLPALVATSSLELGIDMGAIDLVVQIEAPPSVAAGMQRIGRAGHQVGEPSVGKIFPKYRGDLLEAAVVVERMQRGGDRGDADPRHPLDVLAQQPWRSAPSTGGRCRAASARHPWRASATCPASSSRACWTCCRAAIPPTSSPTSSRAWSGIARPMRSSAATTPGSWRSPAAARSRTAGSSASSCRRRRRSRRTARRRARRGDGLRVAGGETFMLGASTWRIEEIRPDRVIVAGAGRAGEDAVLARDASGGRSSLGGDRRLPARGRADEAGRGHRAAAERHAMDELLGENLVAISSSSAR